MFLDVVASSVVFQLDRFPNQGINYGFMVFFNVVLLDVAFILHSLFCQKINGVALLQYGIAFVLFILKHTLNRFGMPLGCTIPVLHFFFFKYPLDVVYSLPRKVFIVNPLYNFGLFSIDDPGW